MTTASFILFLHIPGQRPAKYLVRNNWKQARTHCEKYPTVLAISTVTFFERTAVSSQSRTLVFHENSQHFPVQALSEVSAVPLNF